MEIMKKIKLLVLAVATLGLSACSISSTSFKCADFENYIKAIYQPFSLVSVDYKLIENDRYVADIYMKDINGYYSHQLYVVMLDNGQFKGCQWVS